MGGLKQENRIDVYSHRGNSEEDFNFQDHLSSDILCFTDCCFYPKLARMAPMDYKHQFIRRNPLNPKDGGIALFWKDTDFFLKSFFSIVSNDHYEHAGMVCKFFHRSSKKYILFSAYYSLRSSKNVDNGAGLYEMQHCKTKSKDVSCPSIEFDLIEPHDEPEDLFFSIAEEGTKGHRPSKNPWRNWASGFVARSNKRIATELQKVQQEIDNLDADLLTEQSQVQQKKKDLEAQINADYNYCNEAYEDIKSEMKKFHRSIHGLSDLNCRSGNNNLDAAFSHVGTLIDSIQNCGFLFQNLCDKYNEEKQKYQASIASRKEKQNRLDALPSFSKIEENYEKKKKALLDQTSIPSLLHQRYRVVKDWSNFCLHFFEDCPRCNDSFVNFDGFTCCRRHGFIRRPGQSESDPNCFGYDPLKVNLFPILEKYYPHYYK